MSLMIEVKRAYLSVLTRDSCESIIFKKQDQREYAGKIIEYVCMFELNIIHERALL